MRRLRKLPTSTEGSNTVRVVHLGFRTQTRW